MPTMSASPSPFMSAMRRGLTSALGGQAPQPGEKVHCSQIDSETKCEPLLSATQISLAPNPTMSGSPSPSTSTRKRGLVLLPGQPHVNPQPTPQLCGAVKPDPVLSETRMSVGEMP